MKNAITLPEVVVTATWENDRVNGRFWRLTYRDCCPNCNVRHKHGGGNDPEPSLGARMTHCASSHPAFRPDCIGRRCKVDHLGSEAVELRLA